MNKKHSHRMYEERITAKAVMASTLGADITKVIQHGFHLVEGRLRGRHVYVDGKYSHYAHDGRLYFSRADGSKVVRNYYYVDNGFEGAVVPMWEFSQDFYFKRDEDVNVVLRYTR